MHNKSDEKVKTFAPESVENALQERHRQKSEIEAAHITTAQAIAMKLHAQAMLWRALSYLLWVVIFCAIVPLILFSIRLAGLAQSWTP